MREFRELGYCLLCPTIMKEHKLQDARLNDIDVVSFGTRHL